MLESFGVVRPGGPGRRGSCAPSRNRDAAVDPSGSHESALTTNRSLLYPRKRIPGRPELPRTRKPHPFWRESAEKYRNLRRATRYLGRPPRQVAALRSRASVPRKRRRVRGLRRAGDGASWDAGRAGRCRAPRAGYLVTGRKSRFSTQLIRASSSAAQTPDMMNGPLSRMPQPSCSAQNQVRKKKIAAVTTRPNRPKVSR